MQVISYGNDTNVWASDISVCFPWKQKGRIYNFAFSALYKALSIRTNTQPVHFWNLSRGTASQALATAAFSNTFWLPLALQKKDRVH